MPSKTAKSKKDKPDKGEKEKRREKRADPGAGMGSVTVLHPVVVILQILVVAGVVDHHPHHQARARFQVHQKTNATREVRSELAKELRRKLS